MTGTEYTVDVVVRGGEIRPILLVEKVPIQGDRVNPPAAVWPPFDERATAGMIWATVRNVVAAYELDDCIANIDLMVQDDNCFVLDVNAGRFGGRMINYLARWAKGIHLDRELVAVHTGSPPPPTDSPSLAGRVGMFSLRARQSGRIEQLRGLAELARHDNVIDVATYYAVGDEVKALDGRQVTVAAVLMTVDSPADISRRFEDLMGSVAIDVA